MTDAEKSVKVADKYFSDKPDTWILFSNRLETVAYLSDNFMKEQINGFQKNIFSWNEFGNKFADLLNAEGIEIDISPDTIITNSYHSFSENRINFLSKKLKYLKTVLNFHKSAITSRELNYINNLLKRTSSLKTFIEICHYLEEIDLFSKINNIFSKEWTKWLLLLKNEFKTGEHLSNQNLIKALDFVLKRYNSENKRLRYKKNSTSLKPEQFKRIIKVIGVDLDIFSDLYKIGEIEFEYKKMKQFEVKYFYDLFLIWSKKSSNKDNFIDFIEFILLVTNNLFMYHEINKKLKNRNTLYKYIVSNYKREVLVEEVTDFTLKQLKIFRLLCYPGTSNIFMTGDLYQTTTLENQLNKEDLLKEFVDLKVESLTDIYRFKTNLFNLNNHIYSILEGKQQIIKNAYSKAEDKYKPIYVKINNTVDVVNWIIRNLKILNSIINERFSVGIITCDRGRIDFLKYRTQSFDLIDLAVYHIDDVKGKEFEAVFIVDIDKFTDGKWYKSLLYTAISRASSYLAVSYGELKNEFLKELFQKFFVNSNIFTGQKE